MNQLIDYLSSEYSASIVVNDSHATVFLANKRDIQIIISVPEERISGLVDNYDMTYSHIVFVLSRFDRTASHESIIKSLSNCETKSQGLINDIKESQTSLGCRQSYEEFVLSPEYDLFGGWIGYSFCLSYSI